jgi:predicted O-linked N-acetylglucosamine transferase (SPINDLY family)
LEISAKIIEECLILYQTGRHPELSFRFIELLKYFHSLKKLNSEEYIIFDNFINFFLEIFSRLDFFIPPVLIKSYIGLNSLIAKLTAYSSLKNTDFFIAFLLDNKFDSVKKLSDDNILTKVFTLYSSRNQLFLNYELFFFANPALASVWYWAYFDYKDYIFPVNKKNLARHINYLDIIGKRLEVPLQPSAAYYLSTYISSDVDFKIKAKINSLIKNKYRAINEKVVLQPVKNKIAIISGFLYPGHSVYKGVYRYIEGLADEFELTMIHLGEEGRVTFPDIFKQVIYLKINPLNLETGLIPILKNDFSLIFYPDIGMTAESVLMANLRLAPLQVTGHGHSVSTFGAEIDYFISGLQSENKVTGQNNYSERLVLIPGIGLHPTYRDISLWIGQGLRLTNPEKKEEFIIVCPWSLQKINSEHLQNLKEIINKTEKKLKFIFFTSIRDLYIQVVSTEIAEILGEGNIIVKEAVANSEYMEFLAGADLVIDSFHFGGYNTAIDALSCGIPFVTIEGEHAYNKFAAAVLRRIGLDELIVENGTEFITSIVRIINDDNYRNALKNDLEKIDLKEKLFEAGETKYFKQAIKFLLENHEMLKKQNFAEPIII